MIPKALFTVLSKCAVHWYNTKYCCSIFFLLIGRVKSKQIGRVAREKIYYKN